MTLTAVARITRWTLFFIIIFSILSLGGFAAYRIWYNNYLTSLPLVEEKPDTKFGILPYPDFKKSDVSSSNFSYSLDTVTGGLPAFEKIIKVYFIPKSYVSFLAPEKAESLARQFELDTQPEILSETKYIFKKNDKSLTLDTDSGNFIFEREATAAARAPADDEQKLIQDFKNLLEKQQLLSEELKKGPHKIKYLEDQTMDISLWQENIEDKPIANPTFIHSLVRAKVLGSALDIKNYLSLNYTWWKVDKNTFATYPIKTAQQAYEDLKSGKASIVINPSQPQVSITSVYLGYYLSENYTPYLMPIFIFEGPSFVAYVPAISGQFIEQAR